MTIQVSKSLEMFYLQCVAFLWVFFSVKNFANMEIIQILRVWAHEPYFQEVAMSVNIKFLIFVSSNSPYWVLPRFVQLLAILLLQIC